MLYTYLPITAASLEQPLSTIPNVVVVERLNCIWIAVITACNVLACLSDIFDTFFFYYLWKVLKKFIINLCSLLYDS